MKKQYLPKIIEPYVQEFWKKNKTFEVFENPNQEKYYCLSMFPYPSGNLHMGHVRNYTIGDVIARFYRMLGKNVLHPIGWDAFGLPAEEAAIRNNTDPETWTYNNIRSMKKQLKTLGFSYDWSREITTCKPEYYRWEQWFFSKLYKNNLVYKKNSFVNWCENDQTVLANEQVINGSCWRCNGKINLKKIPQWFIKIKKYAQRLLDDLQTLKEWPEKVKTMQKNWIGKLEGIDIDFRIFNSKEKIKIYTNRPDILMGVTYVVISPMHKFSKKIAQKNKKILDFINKLINVKTLSLNYKSKNLSGINTNISVIHPITEKKLPLWISNSINVEYETDAIMGVPAHNQNDLNFSIKYNLKIKPVLLNLNEKKPEIKKIAMLEKGRLFNSEKFNGLTNQDGCNAITKFLLDKRIGTKKINYKLKDWCISRQRYWGTPIPMATLLKNKKTIAIPNNQLPIIFPSKNINIFKKDSYYYKKQETQDKKWKLIKIDGKLAKRETDTFDTFMESSWYYIRYTCPDFHTDMIDSVSSNYWLPIDQYIGGIEHATMHLMYFRFYHKLLYDFGLINSSEPTKKLLCQGMVLSEAFYFTENNGKKNWISPKSVQIERNKNGEIIKATSNEGKSLVYAGMIKMSKSKFNGVEPNVIINQYGADTIRLFIMFAAPVEASLEWKESGVQGIYRFLQRLWSFIYHHIQKKEKIHIVEIKKLDNFQKKLYQKLHKTIDKVSIDIQYRQNFNNAIASIMHLTNTLITKFNSTKIEYSLTQEVLIAITKMLYPFTPHFSFIIWKALTNNPDIDKIKWPIVNREALADNCSLIIVQINGKKRYKFKYTMHASEKEIFSYIKKKFPIKKYLLNKSIKKIIYIPNKLINLVI